MVKPVFNTVSGYDDMSDLVPLSDSELARRLAGYMERYPMWQAKQKATALWTAQKNDETRFERWLEAGKPDLHTPAQQA